MTEILGVVPARGGSKAIPRKNVLPLAGKPLIAYTLEAAYASETLTRVVVTTDDREIASVASSLGADVPFLRPRELAEDGTTDLPVFQHCLSWLEEGEAYKPDLVVHLRPTAPLRTSRHIDAAVRALLEAPAADSLRSITPAGQHPLKAWALGEAGSLSPFVPPHVFQIEEAYNQPRQRLPEVFIQNGAVDVIRSQVIRNGSMSGTNMVGFLMDELESVNIDSPLDWRTAEALIVSRRSGA